MASRTNAPVRSPPSPGTSDSKELQAPNGDGTSGSTIQPPIVDMYQVFSSEAVKFGVNSQGKITSKVNIDKGSRVVLIRASKPRQESYVGKTALVLKTWTYKNKAWAKLKFEVDGQVLNALVASCRLALRDRISSSSLRVARDDEGSTKAYKGISGDSKGVSGSTLADSPGPIDAAPSTDPPRLDIASSGSVSVSDAGGRRHFRISKGAETGAGAALGGSSASQQGQALGGDSSDSDSSFYDGEDTHEFKNGRPLPKEIDRAVLVRRVSSYRRGSARLVNQYSIRHSLGEGAFGRVRAAVDITTGSRVAIKKMSKARLRKVRDPNGRRAITVIRAGLNAGAGLRHPNILEIKRVIDDPASVSLYVVLDLVPRGAVMHFDSKSLRYQPGLGGQVGPCGGLILQDARKVGRQTTAAIAYMHSQRVTHGDLKPDNLLIAADGSVKVSDFGSTVRHGPPGEALAQGGEGTLHFWSPERCAGDESAPSNPFNEDAWALGVTMYCLCFGALPIMESNPVSLFELIESANIKVPQKYRSVLVREGADGAVDLIEGLLHRDIKKRYMVKAARKSAWFADVKSNSGSQ